MIPTTNDARGRATDGSPALRLDAVRKDYGGIEAVSDVSLEIARGERVGVIGPNGAGKTTLFKLVAGDERPTSGRVLVHGRDVTRLPAHARARLGIGRTYQITNLFPTLTVRENLLLGTRGAPPARARTRVAQVAEEFRLEPVLGLPVAALSYGEQRRIELALALCGDVHTLLLDEPAAGLGPEDRRQMSETLEALPRDLTVMLIEHDIDLTLGLVERVVCLHQGAVVADEPSDRVQDHPVVREIYLGVEPAAATS